MNDGNEMNRYQRFVGGLLKRDRLRRLPVRRSQFLRLSVCNDGVNVVEPPVHAVNLELHAQFGHTIPMQCFVLFVVQFHGCQHLPFDRTTHGQGGPRITQGGSEIRIVRVVHPHRKVHRNRVSKCNASDFNRVHHRNQSCPKRPASYPFRFHRLPSATETSVRLGRMMRTSTVKLHSFPGSGSNSPIRASGSDCLAKTDQIQTPCPRAASREPRSRFNNSSFESEVYMPSSPEGFMPSSFISA